MSSIINTLKRQDEIREPEKQFLPGMEGTVSEIERSSRKLPELVNNYL